MQVNGSIGRASVSKTEGWGFESLLTCHFIEKGELMSLFQDVRKEYSKVQWPRKSEIISSTVWVVVMAGLLSIYLGVFDLIATRLLNNLISLFGG